MRTLAVLLACLCLVPVALALFEQAAASHHLGRTLMKQAGLQEVAENNGEQHVFEERLPTPFGRSSCPSIGYPAQLLYLSHPIRQDILGYWVGKGPFYAAGPGPFDPALNLTPLFSVDGVLYQFYNSTLRAQVTRFYTRASGTSSSPPGPVQAGDYITYLNPVAQDSTWCIQAAQPTFGGDLYTTANFAGVNSEGNTHENKTTGEVKIHEFFIYYPEANDPRSSIRNGGRMVTTWQMYNNKVDAGPNGALTMWNGGNGVPCYAALLDVAKAFDTASHSAVLVKAKRLGIPPTLVGAMRTFLSDIQVELRLPSSSGGPWKFPIGRGTPQGSRLSPFFYLLFVSDMATNEKIHDLGFDAGNILGKIGVLFYADDNAPIASSTQNLQQQLNLCDDWAKEWGISFNAAKSYALRLYEPKKSRKKLPQLTLGGKTIAWVSSAKYLGVPTTEATGKDDILGKMSDLAGEMRVKKASDTWSYLQPLTQPTQGLPSMLGSRLYRAVVQPTALYGAEIIDPPEEAKSLQKKASRHVLGTYSCAHSANTHCELGWVRPQAEAERRRLSFAARLLGQKLSFPDRLPYKTLQAQLELQLPWGKALLACIERLHLSAFWDRLKSATRNKDFKEYLKTWEEEVRKALFAEELAWWKESEASDEESAPEDLWQAQPYLRHAQPLAHFGYIFRQKSFNPWTKIRDEKKDSSCHLCGKEEADTPWHLCGECQPSDVETRAKLDELRKKAAEISPEFGENPYLIATGAGKTPKMRSRGLTDQEDITRLLELQREIYQLRKSSRART